LKLISGQFAIIFLFGLTAGKCAQADTLSYADLAGRLTNLDRLATLPVPGERGAQASSYDRASRYDAATDRYIDWGANADGGGIVRREGTESVLAEIIGPGCIWRTWSAAPGPGHVKIYLDGAELPAVDLPFTGYFDRKNEPFTRDQLVYTTTANGANNYTPIPFQKSCKIVADEKWGNYYHFTYTQFPAGTQVPTFSRQLSAESATALDKANQILAHCGDDPAGERAGQQTEMKNVNVKPGSLVDATELTGPGAITALKIKLPFPADIDAQRTFLRQFTIQMFWDDAAQPAVWAPLGDFFACAAGAIPVRSLPTGLLKDGTFYCYWYMPFASKARIALGNDSTAPVEAQVEITHAPLDRPIVGLARFHAKWHRDAFLPIRPDRQPDWTMLQTSGPGRYVGVVLNVWNPRGGWWGEGDEKFFVDGEKFPSTFGTGSEDFFGYAWSSPKTFQRPFHDQPVNENNAGQVSVDRWEIAESVPFQNSFEGCIEKYFPNSRPTLYAATAFWYLAAGGDDPYGPVPVDQRIGYWVRPRIFKAKDAVEAESLKISPRPIDPVGPQEMSGFGPDQWSGDAQLFWQCHQIGRELTVTFNVPKTGEYHLSLRCTSAPDYGTFSAAIDGAEPGKEFDLYAPTVVAGPTIDLGSQSLTAGDHKMMIKAIGKNPVSRGTYFGLDYIQLVSR
jgi:hypothetical protein